MLTLGRYDKALMEFCARFEANMLESRMFMFKNLKSAVKGENPEFAYDNEIYNYALLRSYHQLLIFDALAHHYVLRTLKTEGPKRDEYAQNARFFLETADRRDHFLFENSDYSYERGLGVLAATAYTDFLHKLRKVVFHAAAGDLEDCAALNIAQAYKDIDSKAACRRLKVIRRSGVDHFDRDLEFALSQVRFIKSGRYGGLIQSAVEVLDRLLTAPGEAEASKLEGEVVGWAKLAAFGNQGMQFYEN